MTSAIVPSYRVFSRVMLRPMTDDNTSFTEAARQRAARWLAAWDAQGIHRTATGGDNAGADWLAQEAVVERNRAAQQEFERLVREYNLRVDLADRANATVNAMRDALRAGMTQVEQRVSNLVDQLGSATFGDAVNQASDAADTTGNVFDGLSAWHGIETPESVTSALENIQNFSAGWNIFQAGWTSLSATATPQEKFDSQITGLSSSTPFLFRRTPWVAGIASDSIETIGRTYNAASKLLDDALDGVDHSTDEMNEILGRSLFPRAYWLNDKLTQLKNGQLSQFFGR
jgi:hypothetical protein